MGREAFRKSLYGIVAVKSILSWFNLLQTRVNSCGCVLCSFSLLCITVTTALKAISSRDIACCATSSIRNEPFLMYKKWEATLTNRNQFTYLVEALACCTSHVGTINIQIHSVYPNKWAESRKCQTWRCCTPAVIMYSPLWPPAAGSIRRQARHTLVLVESSSSRGGWLLWERSSLPLTRRNAVNILLKIKSPIFRKCCRTNFNQGFLHSVRKP